MMCTLYYSMGELTINCKSIRVCDNMVMQIMVCLFLVILKYYYTFIEIFNNNLMRKNITKNFEIEL